MLIVSRSTLLGVRTVRSSTLKKTHNIGRKGILSPGEKNQLELMRDGAFRLDQSGSIQAKAVAIQTEEPAQRLSSGFTAPEKFAFWISIIAQPITLPTQGRYLESEY